MEDLLSIVVLILYFIITGSVSKKKKKQKVKARTVRRQEVHFEQLEQDEKILDIQPFMQTSASELEMKAAEEGEDPCHEQMLSKAYPAMRVHAVSQEEMHLAAEGEDPCHIVRDDVDAAVEESQIYRLPIFDMADRETYAQDVLRGVIMSELLERPQQRCCGKRIKRGA